MAKDRIDDFPEVKQIIDRLRFGKPHETVCLFVPSHDRHGNELDSQAKWANDALKLFGELFGGATAFKFCEGVYQPDDVKKPLFDAPIMVQTLVGREKVENQGSLVRLGRFCRDMGTAMEQVAIGLVVNNYFIDIRISHAKK